MRRAVLLVCLLAAPLCADVPAAQCVNILLTGDGWDEPHHGDFDAACDRLEKGLFEQEPYKRMRAFFKFTRAWKKSDDQGCTRTSAMMPSGPGQKELLADKSPTEVELKPDEAAAIKIPEICHRKILVFGIWSRNTAFNVILSPRKTGRIYTSRWDDALPVLEANVDLPDEGFEDLAALAKEAGITPAVAVVLTPDSDLHAGVSMPKCAEKKRDFTAIVMTADDAKSPSTLAKTIAHELGHAVYQLADEYDDDPSARCAPPDDAAPDPANVCASKDRLKWEHLRELGVVKSDPVPGGMMSCKNVFHATPQCLMFKLDYDFCPVCMERISHSHIERAKLITDYHPIRKVVGAPDMRLRFSVQTCAKDTDAACTPRYIEYWELDGERIAGTRRADPPGYTYELELPQSALTLGSHRLRFAIGDGQLFCDNAPHDAADRKAMPWDTNDWWLFIVPSRVLDPLGIHTLFKSKSWN